MMQQVELSGLGSVSGYSTELLASFMPCVCVSSGMFWVPSTEVESMFGTDGFQASLEAVDFFRSHRGAPLRTRAMLATSVGLRGGLGIDGSVTHSAWGRLDDVASGADSVDVHTGACCN